MHVLEKKSDSESMVGGLKFSTNIDSNPASETVDDQVGWWFYKLGINHAEYKAWGEL